MKKDKIFMYLCVVIGMSLGASHIPDLFREKLDLNKVAQGISSSAHLPTMIDSETRADSVKAVGTDLVFSYTLVNYSKFQLPVELENMQQVHVKDVFCGNFNSNHAVLEKMKETHIGFTFKYYNSTGVFLRDFKMHADQCSNA